MKREKDYVVYLKEIYSKLQVQSAYLNEIGQNHDV